MNTVVMAYDYRTAAEAARMLNLGQDWSYPHDADQLRGLTIGRVVYVEGWLHSPVLTTEVAEMVQRGLSYTSEVIVLPRDFATREQERPAAVSAPFMETVTPWHYEHQPTRPRRRWRLPVAWSAALIVLVVGSAGVAAGHFLVRLGQAWGWW